MEMTSTETFPRALADVDRKCHASRWRRRAVRRSEAYVKCLHARTRRKLRASPTHISLPRKSAPSGSRHAKIRCRAKSTLYKHRAYGGNDIVRHTDTHRPTETPLRRNILHAVRSVEAARRTKHFFPW